VGGGGVAEAGVELEGDGVVGDLGLGTVGWRCMGRKP
jgi:hypothetical protein